MAKDSCFAGPAASPTVTGTTKPSGSVASNGIKSAGGRTLESRTKSSRALDEVTYSTQNRVGKVPKE